MWLFVELPLHNFDCTAEEKILEGVPSLGFRSCVKLQVAGNWEVEEQMRGRQVYCLGLSTRNVCVSLRATALLMR